MRFFLVYFLNVLVDKGNMLEIRLLCYMNVICYNFYLYVSKCS